MKPIVFSLVTFAALQGRLNGLRARAHRAWLEHGPGTTREVAGKAKIDLLSFRPRSTELWQIGLLQLIEEIDPRQHEGIYRARTIAEWESWFNGLANPNRQQQLV